VLVAGKFDAGASSQSEEISAPGRGKHNLQEIRRLEDAGRAPAAFAESENRVNSDR